MKRAAKKEKSGSRRSKRIRFAEGCEEELRLPLEIEAQSYLISVKEHFKNDRGEYAEFIQILNDFRSKTCDTIGVITRLKKLFKGHKLLLSFNKFLPRGFEILFPLKEFIRKKHQVQREEALIYIKKVKTRFENEEYIRKGFFEILTGYMKGNEKINDIQTKVKSLFCDHQDLVDEFAYFLPSSTSSALILTCVKDSQREDIGKQGKKNLTLNNNYPQRSQLALKKDVEGTSDAVVNDHPKKGEKEKELKEGNNQEHLDFFEKVKANIGNVAYREIMKCINMHNTKVINSEHLQCLAVSILGKCPEVVDEFNEIISQSTTGKAGEEECTKHDNMEKEKEKERNFDVMLEKENERTKESDLGEEECTKHDTMEKEKEKERNFDVVLEKENERTKETSCEENRENERKEENDREEDKDRHKDPHRKSKVVVIENERKKGKDSEEDIDGHKDQHKKSTAILDGNAFPDSNNGKITYQSMSEMDLSHLEQCTPSYRLLPQNFVKPIASCSTGLAAEVLNDICVSVASGTEDYRKQKQINPYEEAIFICEDDRFELDMVIKNSEAAIKRIHDLLEKIHDNASQTNADFRIEDHLTAMNLRCIELLYGDFGLNIIDLLRETPDLCLPVILKRLQQKHDEWVDCRTRYNIVWADVYAKNYQKSLDHHDSCCKQRDTKSLSRKRIRTHIHL
ncbi:paired amphipathic helix protein Sin3-like 2 isoform X2 [Cryptomeria japonica]|uniref:paired amphipathic helix protein Sin3-like 2 isoform X2 n=1 Tax=Cryptomeria japonica TaxID=3369 RepID=UPI0025AD4424|nr:paired amphipathic helix protein Sin3-like 2 isoform X2 [Cryptomeria japonica]